MPVSEETSIVPDSTKSSSPPVTPHLVKRAVRTYGRPRHVEAAGDDSDISLVHPASSSGSRNSIYRTGPLESNEEIPPSSDPAPSYDDEHHADDGDDNASYSASPEFVFDWKKKLKEMDEQDDFDVAGAGVAHEGDASPSRAETGHRPALSPRRPESMEEAHIPTSPVGGGIDALAEEVFSGSLTTLAASPSSRGSFRKTPSAAAHRRIKRVVRDSDSEDVDNKGSSPTSPAFPHAITTPKEHSSPTPPTSEDDMSIRAKRDPKGKGKAKAAARPNVPPLQFLEEPTSTGAVKPQKLPSKDTQPKKRRIKAPTKKERLETARDRMRILAEQPIAIPRAEAAVQKYSLRGFFSSLPRGAEADPDPDPIVSFSSDPVISPAHPYVEPSPPPLRQKGGSPLRPSPKRAGRSPLKAMVSLPELQDDSDTELPEVGALVALENEKQDQVRKKKELLEAKKRALAARSAQTCPRDPDDDDDDLEILREPDMQMAIKEEDAERKSGRKKRMSEGRKRQLNLGGIALSKQKARASPARHGDIQMLVGVESQKRKENDAPVTLPELNRELAAAVEADRQKAIRAKEEEWTRRGGKIITGSEGASSSVQEASKVYVERGLRLPEARTTEMDVDLDEEDGSDEDWAPERRTEERGSASPSPQPADSGDEAEEGAKEDPEEDADTTTINDEDPAAPTEDEDMEERLRVKLPGRRSTNKQIIDSDSEADEENSVPVRTRTTVARLRYPTSPLATQDSNDEGAELHPRPRPSMLSHRGSLSSMDEPTEDEGDKENETARMWDRGEDKENKAVVRHAIAGAKSPSGTRRSSLFDLGSAPSRESPTSPDVRENGPGRGDEGTRHPLKNLLDDDPFLSPSRSKLPTSFEARLKQASTAAPFLSPETFSPAPFIGAKGAGFSQFSDEEGSARTPGPAPLQPSFSDLFASATEKQGTSLKKPLGGLSASFTEELSPRNKLGRTSFTGDLGLTQDVTLQPAFQVSQNLLRKADQIFEKEQEFVLEAANKKPQKETELYVNDHGFLTQTRPDVGSPEIYRPPSPTQSTALNQPSQPQSSVRRPLRTISLSDDVDFASPAPLNRLRKRATTPPSPTLCAGHRSASPSSSAPGRPANAFDEIMRGAKTRADKPRKLEKSEFIEQEAQESDDDEMFGFGPRPKENDDEEDGEDLDKTLETLVDDGDMDEKTVAAQLVLEKYKEQEEADDLELEKLHQAAVQGELRKKRRNRGLGLDDSDDDSDEDEANRRIRRGMHKKQKIDRDNIKELGEHPETKSFYDVYEGDLIADNGDFLYLQDSQPQDVVMANEEDEKEDEEPQETVTRAEIERRVREIAQQPQDEDEDCRDLRDVSWIDQEDNSDEENLRIKSVDFNVKKQPMTRRKGVDQDFDSGFELPPPKPVLAEGSISRMQSWAKVEGRSRHTGTTGRNVGGAAVTGHKARSGGGSLRSNVAAGSAANGSSKPVEHRRSVKAQVSLLANVAAERRSTRFG